MDKVSPSRVSPASITLVIQIPAFNEEETLEITLRDLPTAIPGIDRIKILVIDDGSTDHTAAIAKRFGVDAVLTLHGNRGLATAFSRGIGRALDMGADIIVNTDADRQYRGQDIRRLVEPILERKADMVIGSRPIDSTDEFSLAKKIFQKVGSFVVRKASQTSVPDAPSGFRAFSREMAMHLNVFDSYTYTLDTVIQAGIKGFKVRSIPIDTNRVERPSRLMRSMWQYMFRGAWTIFRTTYIYQPLRVLWSASLVCFLASLTLGMRFLYFHIMIGGPTGKVQSVVLCGAMLTVAVILFVAGLIADLIAVNRRLLEDIKVLQLESRVKEVEGFKASKTKMAS